MFGIKNLRAPRGKRRQWNKGVSALEFALLTPFVLAVFFAIIEFGSIMYTRHIMFYAAREAARSYVIGVSTTTDEVMKVATKLLANAKGKFVVGANVTGDGAGYIEVDISTPMAAATLVNFLPSAIFSKDLTASATMYVMEATTGTASSSKKKEASSKKPKPSAKKPKPPTKTPKPPSKKPKPSTKKPETSSENSSESE